MPMSFSGRRRMSNPFQQQTQMAPPPENPMIQQLMARLAQMEQMIRQQGQGGGQQPAQGGAGQRPQPYPGASGGGPPQGQRPPGGGGQGLPTMTTPDGVKLVLRQSPKSGGWQWVTAEHTQVGADAQGMPHSVEAGTPFGGYPLPPGYEERLGIGGPFAPQRPAAPQTRAQFIDSTYRQYLGRPASPEEQAGYTAFGPEQIVAVVQRSQEAQNAARTGKNAYGEPFFGVTQYNDVSGPSRNVDPGFNVDARRGDIVQDGNQSRLERGYPPPPPAQRPGFDYDGQPSAPAPAGASPGYVGAYAGESGFTRDGRIRLSPNDPDAPGLLAKNPNLYVMPVPPAPVRGSVNPIIDPVFRPQPMPSTTVMENRQNYAPPPPAPTFTQRTGMVSPGASTAAPTLKAHQAMVGGQVMDFTDEETANRFRGQG